MEKTEKTTQKLLRFPNYLIQEIVNYQEERELPFFNQAVFELLQRGLDHYRGTDVKITPDILLTIEKLYQLHKTDILLLHRHNKES